MPWLFFELGALDLDSLSFSFTCLGGGALKTIVCCAALVVNCPCCPACQGVASPWFDVVFIVVGTILEE